MVLKHFRLFFGENKTPFKPRPALINVIRTVIHGDKWPRSGFADYKRGRRYTGDPERWGRPKEMMPPENIKKVHKLVLANYKMKLQETANILKVSKERVGFILQKHLSRGKVFSTLRAVLNFLH